MTGPRDLELVQSIAAGEVIDYTREDVTQREQRCDVVFDIAAVRSLRDLLRVLAPGGRLVMAGAAKGGTLAIATRLAAAQIRSRLLGQHAWPAEAGNRASARRTDSRLLP